MKIILDSTTQIVELVVDNQHARCNRPGCIVPARIWEGQTDSGIPVHCYITRIARRFRRVVGTL